MAEIENLDDAAMLDARRRARLAQEALHHVGVGGVLREQHLDRDATTEL